MVKNKPQKKKQPGTLAGKKTRMKTNKNKR